MLDCNALLCQCAPLLQPPLVPHHELIHDPLLDFFCLVFHSQPGLFVVVPFRLDEHDLELAPHEVVADDELVTVSLERCS